MPPGASRRSIPLILKGNGKQGRRARPGARNQTHGTAERWLNGLLQAILVVFNDFCWHAIAMTMRPGHPPPSALRKLLTHEASGGLILIASAAVALVVANSGAADF